MPESSSAAPPPARGVRLEWAGMPAPLRAAVEQALGGPVVHAATQPSGFSPGVAARLRLADGRRAFVKAVSPAQNPDSPAFHRREAAIAALLPEGAPVPRLLAVVDEGEEGWIALAFEDVEGRHPAQPWQPDELERVLAALARLNAALTPAPPLPPELERTASASFARVLHGWQELAGGGPDLRARLDGWSLRHLNALAAAEAAAPAAVAGDTLLHFDTRGDNILLDSRRVWFVDWPHACTGAAWVDVALFAVSVAMQGGPPPEEVLARHPAAADPAAVTAALVSFAGFFTRHALLPAPPGLPTLRPFQAAHGVAARAWLARRLGWE